MIEIWKQVIGYDNYEVSNLGNVRSLNYNKTGVVKNMTPSITPNNRRKIGLWKNGKVKMCLVYRIVWEAFNGSIPVGMVINHKDENSLNDRLDNLEICTQKYNCNYGSRNDRIGKNRGVPVYQFKDGFLIRRFCSVKEAAESVGGSKSAICQCLTGKNKTSYGYEWRYVC